MTFFFHAYPVAVLGAAGLLLSVMVSIFVSLLAAKIHRKLCHKRRSDEYFTNGTSVAFILRMMLKGSSIDSICEFLYATNRKRVYAAMKSSFFAKEEIWFVGHPALVREVFSPISSKNWEKGDQASARKVFSKYNNESELKRAMIYTGDDDGWRHARGVITPYFHRKDFSTLDKDMDRILLKHLDQATEHKSGKIELLNMTLAITVDIIVQLLYGAELLPFDFDALVKSLAEYIVPRSSPGPGKFPGGMTASEYRANLGSRLGKKAKGGTLGAIIRDSDLPDSLKNENFTSFLEILTPAFASFWVICHVLLDETGEIAQKCKEDPVYRQQCIKEALRMYPPVSSLWPRLAKKDLEIENPFYDEQFIPKKKNIVENFFCVSDPIESKKTIKIPKGTVAMVIPSIIHHDDRFWSEPQKFSPERWNENPFVLEKKKDKFFTNTRANEKTLNYGGLPAQTISLNEKSRTATLDDSRRFLEKQKISDENIRNFMVGMPQEHFIADANYDRISVCTDSNMFEYQTWSYMPFGLGMHACIGGRLALRIVDAILFNFVKHNVSFFNGVVPSMFTSKKFDQRMVATKPLLYNLPADPVFATVKRSPKSVKFSKENQMMRMSITDSVEYRKSGIHSDKLSDLLAKALAEDDSDDSDTD